MQLTMLRDVRRRPRRVAIGQFDGVHLGHRDVIAGSDTVLTFEPHPLSVVRPEAAPRLLTDLDAKARLIERLGVQELVVIAFDEHVAAQAPADFIEEVLVGALGATHVSVGENFRFGHRAAGDADLLRADPRFETRVVALVEVDGEVVSSSHIRALVSAGDVEHAAHFLGSRFQLRGEVVTGDRRGRELGFPTANIVPDERLVYPGHGVYAARADGACAAVSVGVRPTFGTGRAPLIEAYLLDRNEDLYGRMLRVEFISRLRGERRFDTIEALVDQMRIDVEQTRARCGGDAAGGEAATAEGEGGAG